MPQKSKSFIKSQKQLGILLDSKLTFEDHYKTILSNTNRTVGLLRKLQSLLPRAALITIYKAFVRPHLDYGDVLYDQAFNALFHEKIESIQYNACLALTGPIRGTAEEKHNFFKFFFFPSVTIEWNKLDPTP